MRKIALMALVGIAMAISTSSFAQSGEESKDEGQPAATQEQNAPAPTEQSACEPKCASKKVWVPGKVIGHEDVVVHKPVRARGHWKTVKAPCCQKPEQVTHNDVQLPAPKPKIVEVEQPVIVKLVPKVQYAPPPVVHIPPPRTVVYERQQTFAPPPPPPTVRMVCCPPDRRISGLRPCRPGENAYGSASQHASIGPATGNSCNAANPQPYRCPTSSTGWCICKPN